MLAMVALFPDAADWRGAGGDPADLYRAGVEHGVQLLLVAEEHSARAARGDEIYRFSRWQRLVQLELPYAAIGLVWNSMMSVAGAWFFLMACEMFVLGAGTSACRGWGRICRRRPSRAIRHGDRCGARSR